MVQRKDIKTEDIVELYESGLIGREIAAKLDCSVALVQQRLAKAGIKMRPCNERRTVHIDKSVLRELYWDKKMHPCEIGEAFGVHKNTITKKLREFGIPLRTKSQARIKELNPIFGVGHSTATKEKMSQLFVEGRRKVSLQNQYGNPTEYNGVIYRSTWEAGVAFHLDEQNVPYIYEHKAFPYTSENGQIRSYTPDFYLPETDSYIEVKGVFLERDLYKVNKVREVEKVEIELWDWPKLVDLGVINTAGKVVIGLDVIKKVVI